MGLGIQRKKCNAGEIELLLAGTRFGFPFLSYSPYPGSDPSSRPHPRSLPSKMQIGQIHSHFWPFLNWLPPAFLASPTHSLNQHLLGLGWAPQTQGMKAWLSPAA